MKKSVINYILILFFSVVYIYFDGGFLPYTIFYIVLITPVISFLYLFIIYSTFKYSERLGKREYQKGEILDYTLEIHNRSPFYIAYFTVFMHVEGQMLIKDMKTEHLSIKPFDKLIFQFRVPAFYRGKYNIGVSKIIIRDFLNIFSFRYTPGETKHILVFPRILPFEELNIPYIRFSENEYISRNKDKGNTEIQHIRDYMNGDSLKKIHWKLSSKHNKLLTKETNVSSEKEYWIIINLEKLTGETEEILKAEDRTIEVLVSVARFFINSGIVLKVYFNKNEQFFLTFSDMNGFRQMYELFSFIPFNRESFSEEMDYFTESMREPQSVLVFSPVIKEEHLKYLNKMVAAKHDVTLFYFKTDGIIDTESEKSFRDDLSELGIKAVNIYENIKEDYDKNSETAV